MVARQEAIGLESVTDGEFSRQWWHLDFLSQLEGVTVTQNPGPKFAGTEEQPPIPKVTGKLRYSKPVMVEDFAFLKSVTSRTAKFTIPSPSMLHLRAGRAGVAYDDMEEFWSDAAAAYRAAIAAFGRAGALTCSSTTSRSPTSATRRSVKRAGRTATIRRHCPAFTPIPLER